MPVIGLVQKIVGGAALVAILTLLVLWKAADRRADKWESQSRKCSATLERISTARDEQATRTKTIIVEVEKDRERADTAAKRIELAPLPGQCRTSPEIMGADL